MSSHYFQEERRFNFGFGGITYGVQALILANVAVFCLQMLLDVPFGTAAGAAPGGWLLRWVDFSTADMLQLEIWGVATYMFIHSGLSHLFWNMFTLFIAGPEVERALGTWQFLRFYLFCGILGALANFIPVYLAGSPAYPVIGASGAALGTLVAFAVLDPERQFFLFPIPFPITARGVVIIIVALNIGSALTGGGGPVAVTTHLGGMAAGYVYMKLRPRFARWQLQRRIQRRENPRKRKPTTEDEEKLAEAIDNIFKFEDRDRK